jgi:hypothetical protein
VLKWCHSVGAASTFLDGADAPFFATDVELGVEVASDGAAAALKLGVAKDSGDSKAALPIDTIDVFECLDERSCLAISEDGGRNEPNVPGDRKEERNLVYEHDINTQRNVAVLCHDFLRDVGNFSAQARESTPGRLALHRANVTSKDVVCVDSILAGDGAVGERMYCDVSKKVFELRSAN